MAVIRYSMLIITILYLFAGVKAQNGNQGCVTRENAQGTCKYFSQCPKAREDYNRGIYPTLCKSGQGFVCCPGVNIFSNSGIRISEQKCREYTKATVEVSYVAPLSLGSSSASKQTFENFKCVQSTPLIVGGELAKLGEFPHMAAIGWKNSFDNTIDFKCGGSLISNWFVLSAAHCNSRDRNSNAIASIVRLGDQNLFSKSDGAKEIDVGISQFINHESYNGATKKNDIAVIRLVRSVQFTDFIRPACLWQTASIPSAKTVASGYGKTGYNEQQSNELLKVQLNILDNSKCQKIFQVKNLNIDSSQMCVGGGEDEEKDTCQGDSGGPIQIHNGKNRCIHFVIGITSFGSAYCYGEPGVYTRVSSYLDWIEQKVWG